MNSRPRGHTDPYGSMRADGTPAHLRWEIPEREGLDLRPLASPSCALTYRTHTRTSPRDQWAGDGPSPPFRLEFIVEGGAN